MTVLFKKSSAWETVEQKKEHEKIVEHEKEIGKIPKVCD